MIKIFPNNHIYFDNLKIIFYNCVIEEVIALANFAERMRSLRKEKGLKKTEVAKGIGLDRSTVTNYESGKRNNPTAETLQRIADYFDVSIDYLTGKSDIRDKLTATELIQVFRKLTDENKLQLIKYAKYLEKEQEDGECISD